MPSRHIHLTVYTAGGKSISNDYVYWFVGVPVAREITRSAKFNNANNKHFAIVGRLRRILSMCTYTALKKNFSFS